MKFVVYPEFLILEVGLLGLACQTISTTDFKKILVNIKFGPKREADEVASLNLPRKILYTTWINETCEIKNIRIWLCDNKIIKFKIIYGFSFISFPSDVKYLSIKTREPVGF